MWSAVLRCAGYSILIGGMLYFGVLLARAKTVRESSKAKRWMFLSAFLGIVLIIFQSLIGVLLP